MSSLQFTFYEVKENFNVSISWNILVTKELDNSLQSNPEFNCYKQVMSTNVITQKMCSIPNNSSFKVCDNF